VRAYNTFPPHSRARYSTLLSTLAYAAETQRTSGVAAALKGKVEVVKREHKLEGDDLRAFLLALSGVHASASKESFGILMEYLTSFGGDAAAIKRDASAPKVAKRAVSELLATPDHFKCDFADAVAAIAGVDSSLGKVNSLMQLLVKGDVKEAKKFCAGAGKSTLKELGVTEEQCIDKVRLLALAAIGVESQKRQGGEVSYSDVRTSLEIGEGEVEPWLIKAIGLKILEGRMDQLHQVFKVQKVVHQTFSNLEWDSLKDRLSGMHSSMCDVQTKLKTRK